MAEFKFDGPAHELLILAAQEMLRINDPSLTQDERDNAAGSSVILSDFANRLLKENGWPDPVAARFACAAEIEAVLIAKSNLAAKLNSLQTGRRKLSLKLV